MRTIIFCILVVGVISSLSTAQMKLQLPEEIERTDNTTVTNTTLNNSGMIPGSFMVGLLGDVTFPFGEEFKTYAGTAWSVHGMGAYVLNPIALSLKVGYISFGEVETDLSIFEKGAQYGEILTASNSQFVLAAALLYFLSGLSPSCITPGVGGFNPYIGLAICLIFKNFVSVLTTPFGMGKFSNVNQLEQKYEDNSTIFAITPSVGTFFQISKDINLILSLDYYYLFDKADEEIEGSANINYLSITFGAAYSIL